LAFDRNSITVKEHFYTKGPLFSTSVKSQETNTHLVTYANYIVNDEWSTNIIIRDLSPVDAGLKLSYRFQCESSQGAFLMLWDDATKSVVQQQSVQFRNYMRDNHDAWVEFVTQHLGVTCRPEDIVLVKGTIKTSCWTVGAFLGCESRDHAVTLNGQLGPLVDVDFTYHGSQNFTASPVISRSGPKSRIVSSRKTLARLLGSIPHAFNNHRSPVKNQCIFVEYYKMKRRLFLPRKLEAAASGSSTDDNGPSGRDSAAFAGVETEMENTATAVSNLHNARLACYRDLIISHTIHWIFY
jgi:hypothetical protein